MTFGLKALTQPHICVTLINVSFHCTVEQGNARVLPRRHLTQMVQPLDLSFFLSVLLKDPPIDWIGMKPSYDYERSEWGFWR